MMQDVAEPQVATAYTVETQKSALEPSSPPSRKFAEGLAYRFSDGYPLLATPNDVKFAYNLILGREPENVDVMVDASNHPVESVIHHMLASAEFQDLLANTLQSPDDTHIQGFSASLATLGDWLQQLLVTVPSFAEGLTVCRSWRETILFLLEWELFARSVPSIEKQVVRFVHSTTGDVASAKSDKVPHSPPAPRLSLEALRARIASERLFDANWYAAKYRLQNANSDATLKEFLTRGAMEGREPNPLFDSAYYRATYMAGNTTDEPPFFHYLRVGADLDFAPSPLISPAWVRAQLVRRKLPDAVLSATLHKCSALRLSPHPCFSTRFYLQRYPDLTERRIHPLMHYLQNGARERRIPHPLFWPEWFTQLAGPAVGNFNPLIAYLYDANLFSIAPNPFFDPDHYLASQPTLKSSPANLLQHYLENVEASENSPNPALDIAWARNQYRIQLDALSTDPLSFLLGSSNGFTFGNPAGRDLAIVKSTVTTPIDELRRKVFGTVPATVRRRRIVYLSHNLKLQGAQTSLFELASGMARDSQHEVMVLSPDEGPMAARYASAKIPVHKYTLPVAGMADEARYAKLFEAFKTQIREIGPDLLHGNTIQAYHAVAAASEQGIPAVWNIRESEEPASHFQGLASGARQLLDRALHSPAKFVFVSRTTQKLWLDAYPELDAATINNGLNYSNLIAHARDVGRSTARALFGVAAGEIMIFNVGTWTNRKGQRDIPQAMRLVDRRLWPRLRVVLIGANDSDYGEEITQDIADLPVALRDRFSIYKESSLIADRAIVYSAYHAADIFLFTSRIESYPRVVNEALYFGLPIITTPCFGVLEQIEPGASGLFYEPTNALQLSRHVELLAVDPRVRQTFAQKARHAAFNTVMQYDDMLSRYRTVYETLIGGGPKPSATLR